MVIKVAAAGRPGRLQNKQVLDVTEAASIYLNLSDLAVFYAKCMCDIICMDDTPNCFTERRSEFSKRSHKFRNKK